MLEILGMSFINLFLDNGKVLYINNEYLKSYREDLDKFLDGLDYMKNKSFAKQVMFSSNNKDNINNGYQYILEHNSINKDSLKELYNILSKDLLSEDYLRYMGLYYREKPVYITNGSSLNKEPFKGVDYTKLDYYMDSLFEFINEDNISKDMDYFIKSQIIYFYLIYLHPYFDINGRTGRLLAMWYLLNKESYPYVVLNRSIIYNEKEHELNIIKGRLRGEITLFLKDMLIRVQKELEKEYVICSIQQESDYLLTRDDREVLGYLLGMNGNLTIKDLIEFYKCFNNIKKDKVLEKVMLLMKKEIIINKGYTKGHIFKQLPNMNIGLNEELINIDREKVKYLKLNRFI